MSSLRKRAFSGVVWSSIEVVGVRLAGFLTFLVLARVLSKEDFGLVALAGVYTAFLELVVRVGMTEVLVQRKDLTELHKDTAFWATTLLGLIAVAGSVVIAPFAAQWSGTEELEAVISVLAISLIPISLSRVQQGILLRELRFRSVALRRLVATLSGAVVGITMALNGYGVWSLVMQQLVERFVEMLMLFWVTRWFPSIRFSWQAFTELWGFASRIFVVNFLQFASTNLDRLLIGQLFGIAALGIYVVARRFIEIILAVVRVVVSRVALSAFSRLQSDRKRLLASSLTVGRLCAIAGLPIMGVFVLCGDEITTSLFGAKWENAGILSRVIALGGLLRMATLFAQPLLKSTGHPGSLVTAHVVLLTVSLVFSLSLSGFGLTAFVSGWVVGQIGYAAVLFYSIRSRLDYPLGLVFSELLGPSAALGCALAGGVLAKPYLVTHTQDPLVLTATYALIFFVMYLVFLALFSFRSLKSLYSELSLISKKTPERV